MGKLKLTEQRRRTIAAVAACVACFGLLDVGYQARQHLAWRGWMRENRLLAAPASQPASQPASTQAAESQPAKDKPGAKPDAKTEVKVRNPFVKPKPGGHGMSLTGVLGHMAMFKDRDGKPVTIEEGSSAKGVKVKSINDYDVTIEFEGKPETLKLFTK